MRFFNNKRRKDFIYVLNPPKDEANNRKWDWESIFKFIGVILTFITIGVGIYQYKKGTEYEFRSDFYSEQIKVYNELLQLSSSIAAYNVDSLETKSFLLLEADFNELYYGKLNLYQNEDVADKTSYFFVALKRFKDDEDGIDNELMMNLVYQIAQACRESLAATYDIDLMNLRFDYKKMDTFLNDSTSE